MRIWIWKWLFILSLVDILPTVTARLLYLKKPRSARGTMTITDSPTFVGKTLMDIVFWFKTKVPGCAPCSHCMSKVLSVSQIQVSPHNKQHLTYIVSLKIAPFPRTRNYIVEIWIIIDNFFEMAYSRRSNSFSDLLQMCWVNCGIAFSDNTKSKGILLLFRHTVVVEFLQRQMSKTTEQNKQALGSPLIVVI